MQQEILESLINQFYEQLQSCKQVLQQVFKTSNKAKRFGRELEKCEKTVESFQKILVHNDIFSQAFLLKDAQALHQEIKKIQSWMKFFASETEGAKFLIMIRSLLRLTKQLVLSLQSTETNDNNNVEDPVSEIRRYLGLQIVYRKNLNEYFSQLQQLLANDVKLKIFISYADDENHPEYNSLISRLGRDLEKVGIQVKIDAWPASEVDYIRREPLDGLDDADYVLLIGTPELKKRAELNHVASTDNLLRRLSIKLKYNPGCLIPVLMAGKIYQSFPNFLNAEDIVHLNLNNNHETDDENLKKLQQKMLYWGADEQYGQMIVTLFQKLYEFADALPQICNLGESFLEKQTLIKDKFPQERMEEIVDKELAKEEVEELSTTQPEKLNLITRWNLPVFSHDIYIERSELTEQIQQRLQHSRQKGLGMAAITALHGLGGVGKTQLALNYAYRTEKEYRLRIWFQAENLLSEYQKFAIAYQLIHKAASEDDVTALVTHWFETHPTWLIVYDNAENLDSIQKYFPRKGGDILITSRNPKWNNSVSVDVMTPEQAIDFVKTVIKREDEKIAELVKVLGYLPLALAQAAAYIKQHSISVTDYLKLYKERCDILLADPNLPPGHKHEPVAITWRLNFEAIHQKNPKAARLLQLISFLHPDSIPIFLLQYILFNEVKTGNEITLNQRLNVLQDYSLIKRNEEAKSVSIHRLVQTMVREKISPELTRAHLCVLMSGLDSACSYYYNHHIWITTFKEFNEDLLSLFTNMALVLEDGVENLVQRLEEPHFRSLFFNLIHHYFAIVLSICRGMMSHVIECGEVILLIQEKLYGIESDKMARTLIFLGIAYGELEPNVLGKSHGNLLKKKVLLERALSIQEQYYGTEHYEVAHTLTLLGDTYVRLEEGMSKIKDLFERALDIQVQYYGMQHYEVANTLINLGIIYLLLKNKLKTKELLDSALHIIQEQQYKEANMLRDLWFVYVLSGDCTYDKLINQVSISSWRSLLPSLASTLLFNFDSHQLIKQPSYSIAELVGRSIRSWLSLTPYSTNNHRDSFTQSFTPQTSGPRCVIQ